MYNMGMKQYLELMREILNKGHEKSDRTGVGTKSLFGAQMRFDLREGFPLVTTKKVHLKSIIYELLWFLKGETNTKWLKDNGVTIWDEWADENGNLGPIYGKQWRKWEAPVRVINTIGTNHIEINEIDQVKRIIDGLKNNPDSRRHLVTAWNPGELTFMRLAPCHCLFQMWTCEMTLYERLNVWNKRNNRTVTEIKDIEILKGAMKTANIPERYLSCHFYMRSNDVFLGTPFNIASYALLVSMIAQCSNMEPYELIYSVGDAHIYLNHLDQVKEQLTREPKRLPKMELNSSINRIDDFKFEDFTLLDYESHPAIKAPIAI